MNSMGKIEQKYPFDLALGNFLRQCSVCGPELYPNGVRELECMDGFRTSPSAGLLSREGLAMAASATLEGQRELGSCPAVPPLPW